MGKLNNNHISKIFVNFTAKQMTNFVSSKEFKKRVMDFIFNAVDDVVTIVYDEAHKKIRKIPNRISLIFIFMLYIKYF